MARTMIDLDRELVDKAKKALGDEKATTKDTVHEALRRVVREHAHREFLDMLADMDDEQVEALRTVRDTGW